MNKRIIIIGASGHGKVIADIASIIGYDDIAFLDDDTSIKECFGYPVIGKSTEARYGELFIAVGCSTTRKRLMEYYADREFATLIHPHAVIARDVEIGKGSAVMAGAVINPAARIGKGCIINTSSSVDHDCVINDYCHVSVGAHLCGNVNVGAETWIGSGAIVSNNINICEQCIIGAGAVVIKDIQEPGTYVGVPVRKSK